MSVLVGFLALVMVPGGVVLSGHSERVTLINSTYGSVPAGVFLGLCAIVLGRRAHDQVVATLGRSGGEAASRLGRLLGALAVCVAITAGLAVGFYGLLTLVAD